MKIACTPGGTVGRDHPGQGIIDIKRAGFENVLLDFSMYCRPEELEFLEKMRKKGLNQILTAEDPEELAAAFASVLQPLTDRLRREQIALEMAYAPFLQGNTKRPERKQFLIRLTKECIRICGRMKIPAIVIRPWSAGVEKGSSWEVNREYYLSFIEIARENNVIILLENQCRDINGHLVRGICADEVEAVSWIRQLNELAGEERFGFCLNVGACSLCGQNMYDFAKTIGEHLKAVVLKDCNGNQENALLPFTAVNKSQSQTDWLNLIRGLREMKFDGALILDMQDTAAAVPPLLRPALLQLAKKTADYFAWQINMERLLGKYPRRVLFGAGNMCRNYMKCYGEKYPPLFTCDNNRARWGTKFEGLDVKDPQELLKLPKNTAVFICNVYYREIEEQLRGMGLENPIEYFNDEYMPTFYFDRLEMRG